ncbi:MAG: hypothetical protein ABLQ96_11905, partial [Candidatus Acidiferrum sp.]
MGRAGRWLLGTALVLVTVAAAGAQSAPANASPAAVGGKEQVQTAPAFDVHAAVESYLAKMPAERRARSNAYFEGGYWLLLWDFLLTCTVMWA